MEKLNPLHIILIAFFGIGGITLFLTGSDGDTFGGGLTASSCTTATVTAANVGDDISSTVLSASGNRAYAIIQMPSNATNTVALSFDEGAAASLTTGVLLGELNATTTTNLITFGRATGFPYTGAVTGITNVGSSTVHVTECNY